MDNNRLTLREREVVYAKACLYRECARFIAVFLRGRVLRESAGLFFGRLQVLCAVSALSQQTQTM